MTAAIPDDQLEPEDVRTRARKRLAAGQAKFHGLAVRIVSLGGLDSMVVHGTMCA